MKCPDTKSLLLVSALLALNSLMGQETFDPRTGLCHCDIEAVGSAQGGEVGIGFVTINSSPVTIKSQVQETAQQVMARLALALKTEKKWIVDVVDPGNILRIYNVSAGMVYLRSSDPGISSGRAVADLRSASDPATSSATLTWRLPDPLPDTVYVRNSAGEETTLNKEFNQYVYPYPEDKGWGCWFFVVCGYSSSSGGNGITRYSDLCQVWVDNPRKMASRDLRIVVNSTPIVPFLDRDYSCELRKVGGTNPCSWSIVQGSLPPGLALDSNGRISGKATQTGRFPVTVKLRDATGAEASASVDIEVMKVALYRPQKD